jgi:2-hydroxy-4-carboxymuconate semialdehyde hemiacetal dehydrogenase
LVNIAMLGYGSIAHEHVKALADLQGTEAGRDLRLHVVMGRRREPTDEFAHEYGFFRATTELEDVLADPEVDVVIVCSPSDAHAEQTRRALAAGKHVLCEIPLATSLAETDELIELAEARDRRLMVCHTQRYYPALEKARRMIESGELQPHAVVWRYGFLRRSRSNWVGRTRSWTDNLIWHHGCHAVDAALWLLGAEQAEVVAQVGPPGPDLGIPMDLTVAMRTPRDELATVVMSYNTHLPVHDCLIIGRETTLEFLELSMDGRSQLRGPDGLLVSGEESPGIAEAVERQDAEFFAAVREGREPAITGRSVRPAMVVLQAVQDELERRVADGS